MAVQYTGGGAPRPMGPRPPMGSRPGSGPRRPYPSNHIPQVRKNERIRALEVRVIGHDGKQIGVLPTREAMRIAQTQGFDLVEVSPGAHPPVCKILDYGKYMYEEGKKQKHHKAHASKLKEVKFRPRIEHHDYITKLRHVEEFLFHSDKVKLTLFFKGREMEHKELGFETMKRAITDLAHVGTPDQPPRMFGRNITTTLSPLPPNKRKWKYNLREDGSAPHAHDLGHAKDQSHEHDDEHDDEEHEPDAPKAPASAASDSAKAAKPPSPGV